MFKTIKNLVAKLGGGDKPKESQHKEDFFAKYMQVMADEQNKKLFKTAALSVPDKWPVAAVYATLHGLVGTIGYTMKNSLMFSNSPLGTPAFPSLPADMPETGIIVEVNGVSYTVTKAQLAAVHMGGPIPPDWMTTEQHMAKTGGLSPHKFISVVDTIAPMASGPFYDAINGYGAPYPPQLGAHPAFKNSPDMLLQWLGAQPDLALSVHPLGGWQVFSMKHAAQGNHRTCKGPTPYHALALAFHYEFPCDGGYYAMKNDLAQGGIF